MSIQGNAGAMRAGIDSGTARWSSLLPKITAALIVVGLVLGAIVFWTIGTTAGQDVGALIWVATFAGAVALMSIRQLMLAERE